MMKKEIAITAILYFLSVHSVYAQEAGASLEATVGTGYGLYAVTMRASGAPGAISSFYLYEQSGAYPSRWREIDLEFTPGFTGVGSNIDPVHPHILANGQCYTSDGVNHDNLPALEACSLQLFINGTAGSALSFNTYNYRSIDGYPYHNSNTQVFMPADSGNAIFTSYRTYYFYYTPKGVYWTKDLPETKLLMTLPSPLPQPVFVKKERSIVDRHPIWNPAKNIAHLAFVYDSLPLTPKKDNVLVHSGALMKISMNLWDGSNTDPDKRQHWGGPRSPAAGSSSAYKYVAYYPLLTPAQDVGNDPTTLSYGQAEVYSDFTTSSGEFKVNQRTITFESLWRVSNGNYLWPLGQLDERNIYCGNGELILKISDPYPAPKENHAPNVNCSWLNQN